MKKELFVLDYVHLSFYPWNSQSNIRKRSYILDTFSFTSIYMATMEFDEVYEESRGVLVSLSSYIFLIYLKRI